LAPASAHSGEHWRIQEWDADLSDPAFLALPALLVGASRRRRRDGTGGLMFVRIYVLPYGDGLSIQLGSDATGWYRWYRITRSDFDAGAPSDVV
jgi:MYXO-CTERM domain-containing protein